MCTLWFLNLIYCIRTDTFVIKVISWYHKTRVILSLCSIHNIGVDDFETRERERERERERDPNTSEIRNKVSNGK